MGSLTCKIAQTIHNWFDPVITIVCPHIKCSVFIYTCSTLKHCLVTQAFMASVASQAGDTDSMNVHSDTLLFMPKSDLLLGTKHHGQLGVFNVQSLPWHEHVTSEDVFNLKKGWKILWRVLRGLMVLCGVMALCGRFDPRVGVSWQLWSWYVK